MLLFIYVYAKFDGYKMENQDKLETRHKSQDDFLDGLAAVTLIVLAVLLVVFILHDQPY